MNYNKVRLRFALHGPTNHKIFHLVAINAKKARNAQPLETLAVFNRRKDSQTGIAKVEWSVDRIIHWLSKGAEPSKSVVKFLEMVCNLSRVCVRKVLTAFRVT